MIAGEVLWSQDAEKRGGTPIGCGTVFVTFGTCPIDDTICPMGDDEGRDLRRASGSIEGEKAEKRALWPSLLAWGVTG